MKKSLSILAAIILFLMGCRTAIQDNTEFEPLFKNADMTGWFAKDGNLAAWSFKDSILCCHAKGGGWLTSEKQYRNFILHGQWRLPQGGNSGIGLRYPLIGEPSETGMEIQVLDDNADKHKDLKFYQLTGSIYYQVAALQGHSKPAGEWNDFTITADGPLIKVVLNGEKVLEADMAKCTHGRNSLLPLSQRLRQGHIGFQSHLTSVEYKNLEIKILR